MGMSGMAWEHASQARAALNAIVTDPEHGVAVLSNAQMMSNLLKDYLPDAPREKSILVAAAEAGLADTLREHVAQGMDPRTAIRLTASSFSSSTPFTPEACNWVTNEIAIALGLTQPRPPGSGQAGGGEGTPKPTLIATIPGAPGEAGTPGAPGQSWRPEPADQARGQWRPQAPAQGPGPPDRPYPRGRHAAQGHHPGYPQVPQLGGFAPPQGQGYAGQQPQPYPGQPGRGYPGQPGGGYGPPVGFGGAREPTGGRRGLLIGGGVVLLVIIVILAAVLLTKKPGTHHQAGGGRSPSVTATTPPASKTPTPSGRVDPLKTLMDPPGFGPLGTDCRRAPLLGLKASTLISRRFCPDTGFKHVVLAGYQFDNNADYLTGFAELNSFAGFHRSSAVASCQPVIQGQDGVSPWNADKDPRFVDHPGQVIECFTDNGHPTLIWTLPTMNAFFIAQDLGKDARIRRILGWWVTLSYG
jgi:hypothetical protein